MLYKYTMQDGSEVVAVNSAFAHAKYLLLLEMQVAQESKGSDYPEIAKVEAL